MSVPDPTHLLFLSFRGFQAAEPLFASPCHPLAVGMGCVGDMYLRQCAVGHGRAAQVAVDAQPEAERAAGCHHESNKKEVQLAHAEVCFRNRCSRLGYPSHCKECLTRSACHSRRSRRSQHARAHRSRPLSEGAVMLANRGPSARRRTLVSSRKRIGNTVCRPSVSIARTEAQKCGSATHARISWQRAAIHPRLPPPPHHHDGCDDVYFSSPGVAVAWRGRAVRCGC